MRRSTNYHPPDSKGAEKIRVNLWDKELEELMKSYDFWADAGLSADKKYYYFHPIRFLEHMFLIYSKSCVFSRGMWPMNDPEGLKCWGQIRTPTYIHWAVDVSIASTDLNRTAIFTKDDGELVYKNDPDTENSFGFHAKLTKIVNGEKHEKIFGHMKRPIDVDNWIGKKIDVKNGDLIGYQGNTGHCETYDETLDKWRLITEDERLEGRRGAHLHYEYRKYNIRGERIYPNPYPTDPFPM